MPKTNRVAPQPQEIPAAQVREVRPQAFDRPIYALGHAVSDADTANIPDFARANQRSAVKKYAAIAAIGGGLALGTIAFVGGLAAVPFTFGTGFAISGAGIVLLGVSIGMIASELVQRHNDRVYSTRYSVSQPE